MEAEGRRPSGHVGPVRRSLLEGSRVRGGRGDPRAGGQGRSGILIAIVGAHGAGKTTVAEGLHRWLSGREPTLSIHFGKPPRSVATHVLRAWVRLGRALGRPSATAATLGHPPQAGRVAGVLWLLWQLTRARDRYHAYVRASRFAARGGIVICDRYPLDEIRSMDRPTATGALASAELGMLARALVEREGRYHRRILEPDLLIVLRIDPETSVRRGRHGEPASVRAQAAEIWGRSWPDTVCVVDATRSRDEVLGDVRTFLRSVLVARLPA